MATSRRVQFRRIGRWNWTDVRLSKGRVLLLSPPREEVDDGGGIIDFLGGGQVEWLGFSECRVVAWLGKSLLYGWGEMIGGDGMRNYVQFCRKIVLTQGFVSS